MRFVGTVFREKLWDPSGDNACYVRISGILYVRMTMELPVTGGGILIFH
jgi:hypothetical protein